MKPTTLAATTLATLIAILAPPARADELNLTALDDPREPNRLAVSTGAEYAFVAGLRYSRILPFLDRHLVVTADATVPWASFDLADYRVRAGVLVPIVGTQRWRLAGALAPTLRGSHNEISDLTGVGVDASILAGFYTPAAFVAFEAGADTALATHLAPSAAYRMNVDAAAQSHWFSTPGANLRAGLQAGVSFGRYDAILRVGEVRDSGGSPPILPFYGTVSVASRW